MIARLVGVLAGKAPPHVLVDVHGVGYEVQVPMSTFYNLPDTGGQVTLLTQFIVREDAQLLFGFLTAGERESFRELIKISGVGPRIALALLSGLSTDELAAAVSAQDTSRLVKVPGVGKRRPSGCCWSSRASWRRCWRPRAGAPRPTTRPTSCRL